MVRHINDHVRADNGATLSDEQFAKLVELLTPGYELAKLYLAAHDAQAAQLQASQPPTSDEPPTS